MEKANVVCDAYRGSFYPKLEKTRDGELEFTFFRCPNCRKTFLFAVTDAQLRKRIAEYEALARKGRRRRLSEKEIRQARKLLESNAQRSRQLRLEHPVED